MISFVMQRVFSFFGSRLGLVSVLIFGLVALVAVACGSENSSPATGTPGSCDGTPLITASQDGALLSFPDSTANVRVAIDYGVDCPAVEVTQVVFPVPTIAAVFGARDVDLDLDSHATAISGTMQIWNIPVNDVFCGYISFIGNHMVGEFVDGNITINGEEQAFSALLNVQCPRVDGR